MEEKREEEFQRDDFQNEKTEQQTDTRVVI